VWHLGDEPHAAGTATADARHVGFGSGLVDEDQARRIKPTLILLPAGQSACDIRSVLLGRVQAFF
jgi:hypothetical protein